MGVDANAALGYAVRWLVWLDSNTEDGASQLDEKSVNALMGAPRRKNFAAALLAIGWAEKDANGLLVSTDWEKYNGASTKKRFADSLRKALSRNRDTSVTKVTPECDKSHTEERQPSHQHRDTSVTKVTPECDKNVAVEKRREEKNITLSQVPPLVEGTAQNQRERGEEEKFSLWLSALASAHPALASLRYLPDDVLESARAEYKNYPAAAEESELLAAYLRHGMAEDSHRQPFFRPRKGSLYFAQLHEVVSDARRWKKETKWRPKTEQNGSIRKQNTQTQTSQPQQQEETNTFEAWKKIKEQN